MEKTMNMLKGNAVVGQSGGPTAAINATLSGVIRGAKIAKEKGYIDTLYGMRNGIEGFLNENVINLTERFSDENDLRILEQTPSAALGSVAPAPVAAVSKRQYAPFQKHS